MRLDPAILRTCEIACDNMAAKWETRMRTIAGNHNRYMNADALHQIPGYADAQEERDIYQNAADTVRQWLRDMKSEANE